VWGPNFLAVFITTAYCDDKKLVAFENIFGGNCILKPLILFYSRNVWTEEVAPISGNRIEIANKQYGSI
jgi:hypothetical protein